MDSLTAALLAALAAWLSVLAAALLPVPGRVFQRFRWAGAASIALLGGVALGLPVPPVAPVAVLTVGAVAAAAVPVRAGPPAPSAEPRDEGPEGAD